MKRYKVAYTYTEVKETYVETYVDAEDIEEAKQKWEDEGHDAKLDFIESPEGFKIFY